jgi:hypothetical protein
MFADIIHIMKSSSLNKTGIVKRGEIKWAGANATYLVYELEGKSLPSFIYRATISYEVVGNDSDEDAFAVLRHSHTITGPLARDTIPGTVHGLKCDMVRLPNTEY